MTGLVSVVIPAYNAEQHLRRSVESVLAQTYRQFEIIVIDDGSTDHTAEVCRSYADRIRYLHKPNGGVSRARNRGIREANGEYIAFLDADDAWKPTLLEELVGHLKDHPDVSVATGAQVFVSGQTERIHPDPSEYEFDRVVDYFEVFGRGPNFVHTSSAVYRKCTVDAVGGFAPWMRHNEDTEFFIRVSLLTDWYVSSQPLSYYYLEVEGSATDGLEFDQRIEKAFDPRIFYWVKNSSSQKLFFRLFFRKKVRRICSAAQRCREYRKFLHYYFLCGMRQSVRFRFACDCLGLSVSVGFSWPWVRCVARLILRGRRYLNRALGE